MVRQRRAVYTDAARCGGLGVGTGTERGGKGGNGREREGKGGKGREREAVVWEERVCRFGLERGPLRRKSGYGDGGEKYGGLMSVCVCVCVCV